MQFTKLTLISFFILLLIGSIFAQQEKPAPADKGYQLIKTYCYVCHNPNVTRHDQMIAPPMMMVKRHYQPNFTNKEDFINAIVNWVHHPSAEKALMPGAVRKFKIMPPLAYPKEDLEAMWIEIYEEIYEWLNGDYRLIKINVANEIGETNTSEAKSGRVGWSEANTSTPFG